MKKKKKKRGFRVLRVKETFQIGPYKSPAHIWQFHLTDKSHVQVMWIHEDKWIGPGPGPGSGAGMKKGWV